MAEVVIFTKGDLPIGSAHQMTSSTMRPPGFVECYVCQREFGSRSIEIHEPQCLEKWTKRNQKLPKNRRERTPSPPPGHPHHSSLLQPDMSPTPAYTPTSDPDELSTSWSHPRNLAASQHPDGRPRSASFSEGSRKKRPSTATLIKPKVLDLSLSSVDMSEMTRHMLDEMLLSRDIQAGSSDYSSDFTSSSTPSSLESKSPFEDDVTSGDSESEARRIIRPSTIRLPRPSRHIAVPVITSQNSFRPFKKTSSLRSFMPRGRRRQLEEVFTGPKQKIKIPEPCKTCGKEQNPERFHSHPLHMQKFKAKLEEKKLKPTSKLIVTKPTALRYKSKSLDEEKKNLNKKNKLKPSQASNRKSKSVDNSPKPPKKSVDPKDDSVGLKKFIRNQKASIGKVNTTKKFNVEIYEGDSALTPRSENETSPPVNGRLGKENRKTNSKEGSQRVSLNPRVMSKIEEESELRANSGNTTRTSQSKISTISNNTSRGVTAPTLVCYICGREFGSRSLKIHQPQCLEKWKRENERVPAHHQRPVPEPPDHELTREEWNEFAWHSAQNALVPCEWCGRTFFPERLEVHMRGCKPPPGAPKKGRFPQANRPETSSSNLNTSMNAGGGRPTICCYICGREFGSRSIAIHEPQCLRKWNAENDKMPNHLQRPEPVKPETVYDDEGKLNHEAMAEAAWKSHLQTLVACDKCARTFFPDRLIIHQKSCIREQ